MLRPSLHPILVFILCLCLALFAAGSPPPENPKLAGHVSALLPAATRNAQPAAVRAEVDWNDVLATGPSGRLRASLTDGSLLSLGASSQLTVVQHDPASQQTELQLLYGRLRSVVTPRTKPDGKFQIKTPAAAVGVVGTDLYLAATADRTSVLCYHGTVSVTGLGRDQRTVTLEAGQTVDVTLDAVGVPQAAPAALLQETLALTSVGALLELPADTGISATLAATLDVKKAKPGDAISAKVEENVKFNGTVVLPKKSRLLGHVEEAQVRSKEVKESRLAMVWDRALLPSGEEVALDAVLQAVAAPPALSAPVDEPPSYASQPAPGTGAAPPLADSGARGGIAGAATSTVASTVDTAAGAARAPAGAAIPALDASGRLTVASQGAVNLPGMALTPRMSDAGSGGVIISSSGNVKLESGTQLMLRTVGPQPGAR